MKRFFNFLLRLGIFIFIFLNVVAAFHAYKFTHFYDDESLRNKTSFTKTEILGNILLGQKFPKTLNTLNTDTVLKVINLKTSDNINIEGYELLQPISSKGTVICFHGHASSKSRILPEGKQFFEMGYNVLLIDFRAHGNSDGNTCVIGMVEDADIKAAYNYVKNKGENNIILWGISLGASTILHAVNDTAINPNQIIVEMPFGTLKEAVEGRVKMMGVPAEPMATLLTFWGGAQQGLWAFDMKPTEYVKKYKGDVLVQWGKNDQRVQQTEVETIYNNAKTTNKKFVIYENCGHESLYTNENAKWKETIQAFIK